MKSIKANILFVLFLFSGLFLIGLDTAKADSLSIDDNDYQLQCTYSYINSDIKLTITQQEVIIENDNYTSSYGLGQNINYFFETDSQKNGTDASGNQVYRHSNITNNGKCPDTLYEYQVPQSFASEDDEDKEDKTIDVHYFSTQNFTKDELINLWGGSKWWLFGWHTNSIGKQIGSIKLKSEEIIAFQPQKKATGCSYKTESANPYSSENILFVYLYDNITIVMDGNHIATLGDEVWQSCKEGSIYLNNPKPSLSAYGDRYIYNSTRFVVASDAKTCSSKNNNAPCIEYKYNDSIDSDGNWNSQEMDACELLGNETVNQIKRVINILQLLVPILVIVLSGIDLGKMVLSGNLDEELPKKKKIIIVRLILMAFFFFLPLITNILINLLQEAEVINIENSNCIIEEENGGAK